MEEEGLGNKDSGGGKEKCRDVVVVSVFEHDLLKGGGFVPVTGATKRIFFIIGGSGAWPGRSRRKMRRHGEGLVVGEEK
ncbi:hypothetical protein DEO72_LG7g767 [Vigna unguiculata]|uniref:Uncharacterized protein n=1 Tax=Vigna unguiculata TaxID=3917 RepID=A0A4D6MDQ7_VIGUN|nr:hypothetical protein DEO72_LG7g767 [Vigna unguiculata]